MEPINMILSRRSIRKFTKDPVPDDTITNLLLAAMSAPSAGNEQPWHFIVIRDINILNKIPDIHPYSEMVVETPVSIMVCGEPAKETYKGFWPLDCSAATQNILLAAHASGLGSVWLGVYPLKDRIKGLQKLLGIPKSIIPFSILPIGFPAESKPPAGRYDASRVHYDSWI